VPRRIDWPLERHFAAPLPEEPKLLERVPLLDKHLDDYAAVVEPGTLERIRELAAPLQGARVLHVNATAYGGGVAELLATHVPLLRDVGIDAEWQVIHGSDEFFAVTKTVHNALQGAEVQWTSQMERVYLERVLDNALLLEGDWDIVVIHDPQPAAMRDYARARGVAPESTKWVWRCHIDLTDANHQVFEFFRPFIEEYDASVWTMPQFVPDSLHMERITIAPPCIDPLSVKNLDLPRPFVDEIVKQYGIRPQDPLMVQVSRFDPWKDPIGVIEAYRIVREEFPTVQLVLAGSMATDDPEGFHFWELANDARAGDEKVHLLSNIQQVGNVQINAFQRAADVIMQKSIREGFGLTVSEGLWKGRPAIGGRCGGITLQIEEGVNGYLVDSVELAAKRTADLLRDPARADAMGAAGREHVRQRFLSTRELEDWLRLFGELR
jgi:trehalose synthase